MRAININSYWNEWHTEPWRLLPTFLLLMDFSLFSLFVSIYSECDDCWRRQQSFPTLMSDPKLIYSSKGLCIAFQSDAAYVVLLFHRDPCCLFSDPISNHVREIICECKFTSVPYRNTRRGKIYFCVSAELMSWKISVERLWWRLSRRPCVSRKSRLPWLLSRFNVASFLFLSRYRTSSSIFGSVNV